MRLEHSQSPAEGYVDTGSVTEDLGNSQSRFTIAVPAESTGFFRVVITAP